MMSPQGKPDWKFPSDNAVIIVNYCQTVLPAKIKRTALHSLVGNFENVCYKVTHSEQGLN